MTLTDVVGPDKTALDDMLTWVAAAMSKKSYKDYKKHFIHYKTGTYC